MTLPATITAAIEAYAGAVERYAQQDATQAQWDDLQVREAALLAAIEAALRDMEKRGALNERLKHRLVPVTREQLDADFPAPSPEDWIKP